MILFFQGGTYHSYRVLTNRGPGRPKGSRDTVPRRCRVHSSQVDVDSQAKLPAPGGSSSHTDVDELNIGASVFICQSMLMNKSSISVPSFAQGPEIQNLLPLEICSIASECQPTLPFSSTILHPWAHDIDCGESLTPSVESRKLIENDPFHYDWPHW